MLNGGLCIAKGCLITGSTVCTFSTDDDDEEDYIGLVLRALPISSDTILTETMLDEYSSNEE